ncbi:MAG: hypothetical protein KBC64_05690 [Simkaniaceae bacterium]|nr:hypothetical protein [Simkaniaceae bacterium]
MSLAAATGAEKLYMFGTYHYHGDAMVTGTGVDPKKGRYVLLNQTHFHPQGGGQLSDLGKINGVAITHVAKMALGEGHLFDVAHHYAGEEDLFTLGQEVVYEVDAERRRLAATWHSAGHLLAAVVERVFPHLIGVNAHHFPGEGRVEFKLSSEGSFPAKGEIESLVLSEYSREIREGRPVTVDNGAVRTIAFGDHRLVPCGGTHVESTAELPEITIRKADVKKGVLTIGYDLSPLGK